MIFAMKGKDLMAALIAGRPLNAVAREARGSQPQLYKYVNGISKEPKRDTLAPFARYLKVPLDAFYNPELAQQIAAERGLKIPEPTTPEAPPRPSRRGAEVHALNGSHLKREALKVAEALSQLPDEATYRSMCAMVLASVRVLMRDGPITPAKDAPSKESRAPAGKARRKRSS
jgi:transcriptional regulator with XRE-family HTH domain